MISCVIMKHQVTLRKEKLIYNLLNFSTLNPENSSWVQRFFVKNLERNHKNISSFTNTLSPCFNLVKKIPRMLRVWELCSYFVMDPLDTFIIFNLIPRNHFCGARLQKLSVRGKVENIRESNFFCVEFWLFVLG